MPGVKGRSGRKPKPTAMKLLEGNPGHRPLNMAEPKPKRGRLRMPDWLSVEARAQWRWYWKVAPDGVVTLVDLPTLARWAQEYGRYIKCQRDGQDYPTSRLARLQALEAELGIGPSSRSRMTAAPAVAVVDDIADLYFGEGLRAVK